jgi:hypothetical protein
MQKPSADFFVIASETKQSSPNQLDCFAIPARNDAYQEAFLTPGIRP